MNDRAGIVDRPARSDNPGRLQRRTHRRARRRSPSRQCRSVERAAESVRSTTRSDVWSGGSGTRRSRSSVGVSRRLRTPPRKQCAGWRWMRTSPLPVRSWRNPHASRPAISSPSPRPRARHICWRLRVARRSENSSRTRCCSTAIVRSFIASRAIAAPAFPRPRFSALLQRAERDESLAEKVGLRLDIPLQLFRKLLLRATEAVRLRLLAAAPPERQVEIRRVLSLISNEAGRAGTCDPGRVRAPR